MKYFPSLMVLVTLLASCESDELTRSASTERKLELTPRSLEAELYTKYTFKARVTNMSLHDPYYYWDFDEGRGSHRNTWTVDTIFHEHRVHFVRVKAVDPYTEEVLGYDSIRVDAYPPSTVVDLTPDRIDTSIFIDQSGLTRPIPFYVKASTPLNLTNVVCNFGDGSPVVENQSGDGFLSHSFPVGTYTVRVQVFLKNGVFLGSDSTIVTVRFPTLFREDLIASTALTVILSVDSLHPIRQDPKYRNELAIQLPAAVPQVKRQVQGTSFFWHYDSVVTEVPQYFNDTVTGTFAEDLQAIRQLRVSVRDSGSDDHAGTMPWRIHHTYELRDLKLYSVSMTEIMYRAPTTTMADFVTYVDFSALGINNYLAGPNHNFIPIVDYTKGRSAPYAFVIFTR
jgi:hypothetical protein